MFEASAGWHVHIPRQLDLYGSVQRKKQTCGMRSAVTRLTSGPRNEVGKLDPINSLLYFV